MKLILFGNHIDMLLISCIGVVQAYIILAMDKTPNEAKLGKKEKIVKDQKFYADIGRVGGLETAARKGKDFFSKIAKARHQRNREARAAILQPANNLPDGSGE